MSYLSHTLEYPPASLSVWLPDEGIDSDDWTVRAPSSKRCAPSSGGGGKRLY